MADLKWFTLKNKLIIYFEALIEFYNWKNHGHIYEIYKMVKFEKMHILTVKNLFNLDLYQIIEIFFILYNIYIVLKNKTSLCFISITILIKISSINYIILIRLQKKYKTQI